MCALYVHIDHSSCTYINYNRPGIGFVSKTCDFSKKIPDISQDVHLLCGKYVIYYGRKTL